jgi:hypothetical protein
LSFIPSLYWYLNPGFKLELLTMDISAPVFIRNFSSSFLLELTLSAMVTKSDFTCFLHSLNLNCVQPFTWSVGKSSDCLTNFSRHFPIWSSTYSGLYKHQQCVSLTTTLSTRPPLRTIFAMWLSPPQVKHDIALHWHWGTCSRYNICWSCGPTLYT